MLQRSVGVLYVNPTDSTQQAPPLVFPGNPERCPTEKYETKLSYVQTYQYVFFSLMIKYHLASQTRKAVSLDISLYLHNQQDAFCTEILQAW